MSTLFKYINPKLINVGLDIKEQDELLKYLGNSLYEAGYVKKTYIPSILEREKTFPTGLLVDEIGVAIPHSDREYVITPGISISVLENPVPFNNMDGSGNIVPVSIVFMLAIKEPDHQLSLLQEIVELIQTKEKLVKIINSKSSKKLLTYIE